MTDAQLDQLRHDGELLRSIVAERVALKRDGLNRWKGCCPFHGEKTPSFTVYSNGHFHCFGCGAHGSVFDYVMRRDGIEFREAAKLIEEQSGFATSASTIRKPNGADNTPKEGEDFRAVIPAPDDVPAPLDQLNGRYQSFEYVTSKGKTHHYQRRINKEDGGKTFLPLTYGVLNGTKAWYAKAPPQPWPLYRLDLLTNADPDAWVIIVEGEGKCEAAERMFPGYVCTAWMNGAGSVNCTNWQVLKRFREERLIWWPDADRPRADGKAHGCFLATPAFRKMFPRASYVDTDGLADRKDGWDAKDLEDELGEDDDPGEWLKRRLRRYPDAPGRIFTIVDRLPAECDIPRRPWIAPGCLMRGAITMPFGPPDQGKSLLLIGWAVALALGRTWGRLKPVEPMRVMLILAEEDEAEQSARFSAALRAFGMSREAIEPRVCRLIARDLATLLTIDDNTGAVKPADGWAELRAAIEHFRPDVLILDPLAEFHTAAENGNTQLKAVVAWFRTLAREFNLAGVISHHTRKGEVAPGDLGMLRGASSIGAAARFAFTLLEMTKDEATSFSLSSAQRRYYVRLDRARGSYSPPAEEAEWFEKVGFTLDNGDETPALQPWQLPEARTPDQATLAQLLDAIGEGCPEAAGDPWSPQLQGGQPRSVRKLFERHGINRVSEKPTLAALRGLGMVETSFLGANRHPRKGLRTLEGLPQARWLDGEETSQ